MCCLLIANRNWPNEPEAVPAPKDKKEAGSMHDSVVIVPSLLKSAHPWDSLAQEQQQIKTQIEEASRIYLPGHQKMIALNKQLDVVNERLESELQVAQHRFELQLQELLNKRRDLEGKLPEYQELNYPQPIVDYVFARKRCLEVYSKALKK